MFQTPDKTMRFQIKAYDEAAKNEPNMFLTGFFGRQAGSVTHSNNKNVKVDVERDDQQIAVDVNRGGFGRKNTGFLFSVHEFEPPLYDEYAPVTAGQVQDQMPGETGWEEIDPARRMMVYILKNQIKMTRKIKRGIELQASQVIFNGIANFKTGDDIDYNRLATHNIAPANPWSDTINGDPIADLSAACTVNKNDGKSQSDIAIMGSTAWVEFIAHPKVTDYLNGRRIEVGSIKPSFVEKGVTFQGVIWVGDYRLEIYTYPETYTDPDTDLTTNYVPVDEVAVFDSSAYLAKAFAGVEMLIKDNEAYKKLGVPAIPIMVAGEIIPYANVQLKTVYSGVQSAPLLIPVAIDTMAKITT